MMPKVERRAPSWSAVKKLARERFAVEHFRPGQRALVRAALEGRDALGVLPTGAGKSLCYQLPALFLPGTTVVVSPLLALIRDQTLKLDDAGVGVTKLDSTLTAQEERDAAREIRSADSPIVYLTPERLEREEVRALLREQGVELLVVDEAHCVSQWGHDFRPAYLAIRDAVKALDRPAVLALTATATPEIEHDILVQLGIPGAEVVRTDLERKNLFFEVRRTPSEDAKRIALTELLAETEGSVIVYASTTRAVDELFESLRASGTSVVRYHAKLRKNERKESQDAFMSGEARVVVATSAFGLGIDKPDVRLVVHHDFPDSLESYYQEAGRGGRDGEPARAVLLYRLEDRRVQAYFLGGKYPKQEELARVHDVLRSAPGGRVSLALLADSAQLGERRTKVIAALLDAIGIARRVGSGKDAAVKLVRSFRDASELWSFVTAYESRFETDREKLDDMMRYGQTTSCRVRFVAEYFGEHRDSDCMHCDNCRDRPAETAGTPEEEVAANDAALPEHSPPPYAPGDVVLHDSFGRGSVEEVTDEHVRVVFDDVGEKVVAPEYLARDGLGQQAAV